MLKKRKQNKNPNNQEVRKPPKKVVRYRKSLGINYGVLVFLVIFVYIVIMVVSYFRQTHITPYEVKLGSLAINNTYDGVILRDETVVTSDFSGYINYYARESEKVSAYSMVYTVDSTGKLAEMISDEAEEGSSLSNESLSDIKNSISDFAVDFRPEDYIDTYNFKYNIEGTVLKLANTAVLANIDRLRAENYADSIDFGYAPSSGVIQYSTDGYEGLTAETITPEQAEGIDYEKNVLHSNDLISEGDNAYKLITSELWTILVEIDEERAQSLADKNYIEVRFLKNNYTSWAAVSVLRQNGKTYAKLDFNNSMITFASDRFVEIELLDNTREGLKIPNSAIVERTFYLIPEDYLTSGGNTGDPGFNRESYMEDGTLSTEFVPATIYNNEDGMLYVDESVFKIGDYVIKPEDGERYPISKQAGLIGVYNINKGYADFKQITILNQNEEYSIVRSNSEYGLSVYDYIALKGDAITENDFVYD
ncbi:MAG: hypothetical protein K6F87_06185 [Lachnospiraceae bacterium]|nr:hypothetical protein [Lachnospiraceae bacterium]